MLLLLRLRMLDQNGLIILQERQDILILLKKVYRKQNKELTCYWNPKISKYANYTFTYEADIGFPTILGESGDTYTWWYVYNAGTGPVNGRLYYRLGKYKSSS